MPKDVATRTISGASYVLNTDVAKIPQSVLSTGVVAATNMASGVAELGGTAARRVLLDLTSAQQIRLTARVTTAGAAAAIVRCEYSLDDSTYQTPDADGAVFSVPIAPAGFKDSGWTNLAPAARADPVYLRIMSSGGDGVADPALGVVVQVR